MNIKILSCLDNAPPVIQIALECPKKINALVSIGQGTQSLKDKTLSNLCRNIKKQAKVTNVIPLK